MRQNFRSPSRPTPEVIESYVRLYSRSLLVAMASSSSELSPLSSGDEEALNFKQTDSAITHDKVPEWPTEEAAAAEAGCGTGSTSESDNLDWATWPPASRVGNTLGTRIGASVGSVLFASGVKIVCVARTTSSARRRSALSRRSTSLRCPTLQLSALTQRFEGFLDLTHRPLNTPADNT